MRVPKLQLHFIVIGGGLAGVSAAISLARNGHQVTVLEAQQSFSEVGAGIQMPPNATRILDQRGIASQLLDYATSPQDIQFRSYRSGQVLSTTPLIPNVQARYRAPHLVLHRADLLAVLVDEARSLDVELRTGCAVAEIDFPARKVRTVSGQIFTGDVIIGADGEKSITRNLALGQDTTPEPTGKLVYRLTVKSDLMMTDQSTKSLVDPPKITCWLGPGMHILCYNLESRDVCNVVFARADDTPTRQRHPGPQVVPVEDIRRLFANWDEPLRCMLDLAESAVYWPALKRRDIDTWGHPCGSFILIGDAAHTMPPHLVQGAAQGIEDAACLAELFENVQSRSQIPDALGIFQEIRQKRCHEIARRAAKAAEVWSMEDGPAQQQRDREMLEDEPFDGYPNPFSDPKLQDWLYGYDMAKVTKEAWEKLTKTRGHK